MLDKKLHAKYKTMYVTSLRFSLGTACNILSYFCALQAQCENFSLLALWEVKLLKMLLTVT